MAELAMTRLAGSAQSAELLVLGPSLGTAAETLWSRCADLLDGYEVFGWDLPGHGHSPATQAPFSTEQLAAAVRRRALDAAAGRSCWYAGVSLGGAVGFNLAIEPGPFAAVAALASAPKIGDAESWCERADFVRRAGTAAMVAASRQRWFAPGFADRNPDVADTLLASLSTSDRTSYALACEALAGFDLRDRLSEATVPVLVAAGEHDVVVPPRQIRASACGTTFAVIGGCGHLPPAEDPAAVAALLTQFFTTGEVTNDR